MARMTGSASADAASQSPLSRLDGDVAVTIIRPTAGWRLIDLRELWRYRELLYFLTWRDIKVRYKQTVLGAAWAVIQPVMTMVVFTIFFGKLGGMSKFSDAPYQIFVYAALLPWNFFAQSVTQSSQSLIGASRNLITKVYFPRLLVPFASVGGLLVDFAISFAVMLVLMVCYRVEPTVSLLMVPVLVGGTVLAALGAGTFLSALAVVYRDFRYVIPFLVQIWMFASPVAYPLEVVPQQWRLLYGVNPMVGIISGFRSAMLGEPFQWGVLAVSFWVSLATFVAGVFYFRRAERRFSDVA